MRLDLRVIWYLTIGATLTMILVFPISAISRSASTIPFPITSLGCDCVTTAILHYDMRGSSIHLDAKETRYQDTDTVTVSLSSDEALNKNFPESLTNDGSLFRTITPVRIVGRDTENL